MSIYEMSLDLKKSSPIYSDPIVLRQGDTNAEILVHVFDNSTPKNLENLPIEFHADKPDATTIEDDEQSHFQIGADKKSFTYTFPDELTDASGSTSNTYFKIGNDSTSNFYIHILTKAGMEKLESGDYISKVDRIFNHVMSDYTAINDLSETAAATLKAPLDKMNSDYVGFINSKNTEFETYLATLDSQAADVKNKYTALKSQLDALTVAKTGPKGDTGDIGPQGPKGDKGDKGDTGTVDNAGLISAPAFQSLQTQVDKSAVGTNLIVRSDLKGGYLNRDNGDIVGISNNFYSDNYIATNGETVFTFSSPDYVFKGNTDHTLAMYDSGKNYLGYQSITSKTQTLSNSNAAYIKFSINCTDEGSITDNSSDWLDNHRYKLEKGSVATDWCPDPKEIATNNDVQTAITKALDKADYSTTAEVDSKVATGVGQAKTYAEQTIKGIIGAAPETLDTIAELADAVTENKDGVQAINEGITKKADKTDVTALQNTVQAMITPISQEDYKALEDAGTVDPKILYVIPDA